MNLEIKRFDELSTELLYEIIKARIMVFVVEQNCPYMECDGLDKSAYHCFIRTEQGVSAYARIIPPQVKYRVEASLGRVMTTESIRGTGTGIELMEHVMSFMIHDKGYTRIRIEAQKYLEDFYYKFGFTTVSNSFLLDGIEHIEMVYN